MAPQAATVVEAAALALVLPASFRSPNVIGGALGTVKSGNLVVDAARSLALPTMVVAGLRAIGKVLPFRRRKQEAALEEDDLLVDGAEEAAPRGKGEEAKQPRRPSARVPPSLASLHPHPPVLLLLT